jgi:hypothetical protein
MVYPDAALRLFVSVFVTVMQDNESLYFELTLVYVRSIPQ